MGRALSSVRLGNRSAEGLGVLNVTDRPVLMIIAAADTQTTQPPLRLRSARDRTGAMNHLMPRRALPLLTVEPPAAATARDDVTAVAHLKRLSNMASAYRGP